MALKYLLVCLIATTYLTLHSGQIVLAENDAPAVNPTPKPSTSTTTIKTNANDASTSTFEPTTPKPTPKPGKGDSSSKNNPECPVDCKCSQKEINCEGARLKTIPNLVKFTSVTDISLKGNLIDKIDISQLPIANLEQLDLSQNALTSFANTTKKVNEMPKLIRLNLSENSIENLDKLSNWKFPSLQALDLSENNLEDLDQFAFNKTFNLKDLNLSGNPNIKSIHENVFWPLTQLSSLNMSVGCLKNISHLGDKQFVKNRNLKVVDLTDNSLIEVPFALRGTDSIEKLILNHNSMTSLRSSDFINRPSLNHLEIMGCKYLTKVDDYTFRDMPQLRTLILAYNPSFNHISKDAFAGNKKQITLKLLDLRGNNLTTLTNPKEFTLMTFESLLLQDNPWDCSCQLRWIQSIPDTQRSPVHCKTPYRYKDMEISQFFSTTDCDVVESDYHSIIVTGFILFLLGLFIAILVQRNDRLRRLFWKDQYGTIYYTKASFPPEV